MNNNPDPIDSDYYQSLIYMHDLKFDMFYKSPIFNVNSTGIKCTIYDEKNSKAAFRVIYLPSVGILSVASHVDNIKCAFALPEEYLKHNIGTISLSNLLHHLIDFEFTINDDMSVLYREDLEWYFNTENLSQNPKLLNIFLDVKSAVSKFKDYYS